MASAWLASTGDCNDHSIGHHHGRADQALSGVKALTDLTLEVPAGSIYGPGPQRRREDPPRSRSSAASSAPHRVLRQSRASRRRPACRTATRVGTSPGPALLRLDDWARDAPRFVASLSPDRAPATGHGSTRCSTPSASPTPETVAQRPTPVACASGSASPQALVTSPSVLLLDEPVSSLDPIGRREVLELMAQAAGRDDRVLLHAYLEGRPAGERPRRHPRRRTWSAPPRHGLLASFTRDRVRVVVGGADDYGHRPRQAAPRAVGRTDRARGTTAATHRSRRPGRRLAVQRDITRFAVDHDLTLTENGLVRLDLEDVFLRLVDSKERAA